MIDPQALFEKACAAGEDWQDKDYAAGVLEDGLDALRGQITAELKAKGEPISIISNLAKNDPRYISMSLKWREAKKEAGIARLKYDQINRYQDNLRSKESTERSLAR